MESLPKNSSTGISQEEHEKYADDMAQAMVDALNSNDDDIPDLEDPESLKNQ